jgi:hypothetical protein
LLSDSAKCDRVGCGHEKGQHQNKKEECTFNVSKSQKCTCPKFVRKDIFWYLIKAKWFICVGVLGCFIFALSLSVDYSEIKESTVLSTNKVASVGFYLENNKIYNLSVTSIGAIINDIKIKDPLGVDVTPIIPIDANSFQKQYPFTTNTSGIYNFVATVDVNNQWITFVVKEKSEIPIVVSQSSAQVLSFIGGGIIGFAIPMIHSKYNKAKEETIL